MENKDNKIIEILSSFRHLFIDVSNNSSIILNDIRNIQSTNKMVYPCDIIDLRKILDELMIEDSNHGSIPFFSLLFADKYLKEYPIFIVFNIKKLSQECENLGAISVCNFNGIYIGDAILSLIVNEPLSQLSIESILNIVKSSGLQIECIRSNRIPGTSSPSPKLSKDKNYWKKYAQRVIGKHSELPLTSKEKNIFEFLRTVKKDYGLNFQMRVAGGWVRDKLLNRESDDIDIAVDMPGFELAKIVADASVKYNINKVSQPYRVSLEKSADPEKKGDKDELMVGSVNLFGQKIEFVPMRTEHYPDPNSRQPAITNTNDPKEDVKRRDLTINSLYYNIDTGQVEDYVGGKEDLGLNGGNIKLKTPDEPYKTFKEDPLRLLRVLRFHSRYPNSEIDPEIINVMKDKRIHESYRKKVATERAGPEIVKMMTEDNLVDSLRILFDTGLYKSVFKVPTMEDINEEGMHMDQQTPFHKHNLLDHTLEVIRNLTQIMKSNNENKDMIGLMNLAALFHDFGKMKKNIQQPHPSEEGRMQYLGHEDESAIMSDEIMKSIGISRDKRDMVNQVVKFHMKPLHSDYSSSRAKGRFLRKTKMPGKEEEHKDLWKYILYHSQADAMSSDPSKYDIEKHKKIFDDFSEYVNSPKGSFQTPILKGGDIMAIIPEIEPRTGFISEITNRLLELQDEGIIDISFMSLPEGPEKENLKLQESNKAISLVNEMKPELLQKYKENKMANWYIKLKKAQTINDYRDPSMDEGVKKGPTKARHSFQVGMRVRDRRRGVANPQEFGKVEKISGNKMKIVWNPNDKDNKMEEIFDLIEDLVPLSLIVAEV